MPGQYTADAIEVLTGLEPVQRRPGMYTDTTRPNHLAQEVIDNSVDEVIAGFASAIVVQSDSGIEKIIEDIPGAIRDTLADGLPTSIDMLDPNQPFL